MLHDITFTMAGLVSAWTTALLFGILLVVSISYLTLTHMMGTKSPAERFFWWLILFQLFVAGTQMSLLFQQAVYGLFKAPIPEAYFADISVPSRLTQVFFYVLNVLIADSILCWRLYKVYNSNIYIAIPYIVLISVAIAVGFVAFHIEVNLPTAAAFFQRIAPWLFAFWSISICIQVTASALIAWKVWNIERATVGKMKTSRTRSVMWMVLESGAILSLTTILIQSFYADKAVVGEVVQSISVQISSLIPSSMLLRVALKKISWDSSTIYTAGISLPDSRKVTPLNSATMVSSGSLDREQEISLYELRRNKEESFA